MSRYDDKSEEVSRWTNRKLLKEVRDQTIGGTVVYPSILELCLDEIERRFVRSSSRNTSNG